MTLDEFLTTLRATPRDWTTIGSYAGEIRILCDPTTGNEICPITAVEGIGSDATEYPEAAESLGLDTHLAAEIVRASDNSSRADPELRARILAACDLN